VETRESRSSTEPLGARPASNRAAPRADKPAPLNAEVPFAIDEIFFSRTNEKGHILFGNTVFQRISHYSWAELSQRPHSIIRHPDMPRAVFWLLWDTIEKGEPVAAYVKNMAKDGRFYWVFAVVTPIKGGYLSVRIKPTSPLLAIVEREYAGLLAIEQSRRMKPAESAQLLLARLAELGFRDYGAFIAAAFSQEIKARNEKLGRTADRRMAIFQALAEEASALLKYADEVVSGYAEHRYVPLNLRVRAAQLGEEGATIGVIAMNYGTLAGALKTMTGDFTALAQKLFAAVNKGLFLLDTAKIQKEASEAFREAAASGEAAPSGEIALLDEQSRSYEKFAAEAPRSVAAQAALFEQACMELKRAAAALETARIMGKVETARLARSDLGLVDLLSDLERYQSSMAQGLQKMLAMSQRIERDARRMF